MQVLVQTGLTSLKIATQRLVKVRTAGAQDTGVRSPFFSVALDSTIRAVASHQQTVWFVSNSHLIGTWCSHSCCLSTNALLGVLCFSSSSAMGLGDAVGLTGVAISVAQDS